MRIAINNRQRLHRIDARRVRNLAACLARLAGPRSDAPFWGEISLVFTGDEEMGALNLRHLARSEVTDVLCFDYGFLPGPDCGRGIEIIVNAQQAAQRGVNRRGLDPNRELALYIAHGFDHLSGHDDHTPSERRRMRSRELRWLAHAGRLGLVRDLIRPGAANRAGARAGRVLMRGLRRNDS